MVNILGGYMSASSVTGRGLGASFGKYKPENNCGGCHCGCGDKCKKEHQPPEERRIGCYTTVRTGQTVFYRTPNSATSCQVCS